jgi:hypothetical protein
VVNAVVNAGAGPEDGEKMSAHEKKLVDHLTAAIFRGM